MPLYYGRIVDTKFAASYIIVTHDVCFSFPPFPRYKWTAYVEFSNITVQN